VCVSCYDWHTATAMDVAEFECVGVVLGSDSATTDGAEQKQAQCGTVDTTTVLLIDDDDDDDDDDDGAR